MKISVSQTGFALALLGAWLMAPSPVQSRAAATVPVQDEQADPQGENMPRPDNAPQQSEPLDTGKGVIIPPATGDTEIQTTVPSPNAGHDEEVIPPPGTPENKPNLDPR
jgi:hypothetical protein